jgi:hypothetical protein
MTASNRSNFSSSSTGPVIFPKRGAPEADLLYYRDRLINPWSMYRNRHMADVGLWMWYFLGQQWASVDYEAAFDGARASLIRDMRSGPNGMPRPVTNEVDPAVEQAVIALVKRQWTGKATPTSSDPAIKAAAQCSSDMLQHRLESVSWPEKRHQHAFHYVVTGTGLLVSGQDRSYVKLRTMGAPSAVWCETCHTKLYSAEVPHDTLHAGILGDDGVSRTPVAWADSAKPVEPDPDAAMEPDDLELRRLSYCPTCTDRMNPLVPYSPTPDEAETMDDPFGRSMGLLEPAHASYLDVDLPFEFYPQDNGYKVTPSTLRRFGRRKVRSADWLEERYPHLFEDDGTCEEPPDSIMELLQNDPILGNWDMLSQWSSSLDSGILDNHYNVDEMVELPSIRSPLGRYVTLIKDRALEDEDLLIPADINGETYYVPRIEMSVARFKLRPSEIWGTGLPAAIISPQNRLNGLDGQVIHHRLSMGSPNVYMPSDMWVDNPVHYESSYGAGKFVFFQPSLSNPEVTKPEVVPGILMDPSVYEERDRIQADIKRRVGPQDASIGAPPGGVGTTSGLQFLVDQDEQTQSLREDELIRSAEKCWSHITKMEWLLQVDPEEYRVLGPDKVWSYEQYTGMKLRGQVEIKIERGSSISHSTLQREAAREAQADHLIDTSSPVVARKLLELYGLDPDLSPETTYQVDHANRVWVDFRDKGIIRVQDTLDSDSIHYLVLSSFLRTELGERLADQVGWDAIARSTAGWQDELRRMEEIDQATVAFYGKRFAPNDPQALEIYGQAQVAHDDAKLVYEQQVGIYQRQQQEQADPMAVAAQAAAGQAPPTAPIPPTPPPPPVFLPALLQDRILLVWNQMLKEMPPQATDPAMQKAMAKMKATAGTGLSEGASAGLTKDPMAFVKFRALVEAYRLTAAGAAQPTPLGGMNPQPQDPNAGGPQDPNAPGAPGAPGAQPSNGAGAQTSAPVKGPTPTAPMPEGGKH